jgi:NADPH2:quinone reductase
VRALLCTEYGPIENLRVAEVEPRPPGEKDVTIRIAAAGVNYPDALLVQGKYQARPELPFVAGMELAGTVTAVGAGVTALRPGDPVMGSAQVGAFAEEITLPAQRVVRRPAGLAADLAAASLITYGTTVYALKDRAQLQPGETMLVLGAAGGVGTAAIEVGKLMGARVIAAASTDAKLEVCRRLGADEVVNYASEDLRARLKELAPRGLDVVYDPVGGAWSELALRSTGWAGRFLVIGFASGEIPKVPLNLALLNSRSLLGAYWGDWAQRNPERSAANLAQIAEWIVAGRIRPVISRHLRLEDVPQALRDLLDRKVHGKLVVTPWAAEVPGPAGSGGRAP